MAAFGGLKINSFQADLVIWQVVVRIMDRNGIAILKYLPVQDDISAAYIWRGWKKNSRVPGLVYQITENTCKWLDMHIKYKIAPDCIPICP